jgi:hypothetical protein
LLADWRLNPDAVASDCERPTCDLTNMQVYFRASAEKGYFSPGLSSRTFRTNVGNSLILIAQLVRRNGFPETETCPLS